MIVWAAAIPIGFLIGSIPFGFIIGRIKGIDVREHGSGNIGATNVGRVLGRRLGAICFALDLFKGLAPTLGAGLAAGVVGGYGIGSADAWWWLAVMVSPVLGHMYSPWIGFRGGKGVATGLGALLGVAPILTGPALGALAVWNHRGRDLAVCEPGLLPRGGGDPDTRRGRVRRAFAVRLGDAVPGRHHGRGGPGGGQAPIEPRTARGRHREPDRRAARDRLIVFARRRVLGRDSTHGSTGADEPCHGSESRR